MAVISRLGHIVFYWKKICEGMCNGMFLDEDDWVAVHVKKSHASSDAKEDLIKLENMKKIEERVRKALENPANDRKRKCSEEDVIEQNEGDEFYEVSFDGYT